MQNRFGRCRPDVSIITPTKNRLKLLCEAMDSLQQQSFDAWEHIIVDDGSDDGTDEEVTRRAAADPRIRFIQRKSDTSGANVCRNFGIKAATAEFIVFLDSDDLLAPHCLRQRVAAMDRNRDLGFAVFPGEVFTEAIGDRAELFSPTTLGSDLDRVLCLDHPWPITGPIWRKSALEEIGLLAEELPSWQDVELNFRALTAGIKYLKFDTPDHYIRWQYEPTKTSVQQFRSPAHLRSGLAIVESFQSRLSNARLLTWSRRRALAGLIFLLSERWSRNGDLSTGIRVWFRAYQANFVPLFLYSAGTIVLLIHRLALFRPPYDERFLERFRSFAKFVE